MKGAKYAEFDPATKEFGEAKDATNKLEFDISTSGKVTFTAKFSGITKVMLSYAGMEHEFIVITPGDVNLNGELDDQDWGWVAGFRSGKTNGLPTYEATVNGNTYSGLLGLMMDMDSTNVEEQSITFDDALTIANLQRGKFNTP